MGVGGQCHAPAALPPGKTRYPLYRRLRGPQRRSGWLRRSGFEEGNVSVIRECGRKSCQSYWRGRRIRCELFHSSDWPDFLPHSRTTNTLLFSLTTSASTRTRSSHPEDAASMFLKDFGKCI